MQSNSKGILDLQLFWIRPGMRGWMKNHPNHPFLKPSQALSGVLINTTVLNNLYDILVSGAPKKNENGVDTHEGPTRHVRIELSPKKNIPSPPRVVNMSSLVSRLEINRSGSLCVVLFLRLKVKWHLHLHFPFMFTLLFPISTSFDPWFPCLFVHVLNLDSSWTFGECFFWLVGRYIIRLRAVGGWLGLSLTCCCWWDEPLADGKLRILILSKNHLSQVP